MKKLLQLSLLLLSIVTFSQTGVIKGIVLDKQSDQGLPSATVTVLTVETSIGTTSNIDGYYTLQNIPLGRHTIQCSFLGYETVTIPNIEVTSGKEVIIDIGVIESLTQLDAVVISVNKKNRAINEMAMVSARQFGLEEATRYSGGRGDVGRLAANFAGVSSPDDSRNDIVVRGNSPSGLLWRLEGIPIANPNHFSTFGSTGGPVSAVNPNVLKNSDFLTSAFPAEYGNAIGGVFDLGFRNGNKDTYEYNLQMGAFTGVEAMAEGPLGKNNGSFLVAFRYSLVGLIGAGAAGASTATPNYADVSFNLNFGKSKLGAFSLFGILGQSDIDFLGDEIDEEDLFAAEDEDLYVASKFYTVGLKNKFNITQNTYLKSIIAASISENDFRTDRYYDKDTPQEEKVLYAIGDNQDTRLSFSTMINSKLNKKLTLRGGLLMENYNIESLFRSRSEQSDNDNDGFPDIFTFANADDMITLWQPFAQGAFRLSDKWTTILGVHGQYSDLNNQFVLEPRLGLTYRVNRKNSIHLGYGVHHQTVPFPTLFLNEDINGVPTQTNTDLDFVRSDHFVLGYDTRFTNNWRAKLEGYYQLIDNAAVELLPSSYSSLTEGASFGFENDRVSLVNEGTGFNRGVELTVEKFFSKGYYGLLTTSLYESKYEGSDKVERNSPFNNGYVLNILAGKEFALDSNQRRIFFTDTRMTISGGRYYTPIDLEASRNAGFEVPIEDEAYSLQNNSYFRWDVKLGIKINRKTKKQSHKFYVDLQNITNKENIFIRRYNRLTNNINEVNQIGFFPDVGYKFQF